MSEESTRSHDTAARPEPLTSCPSPKTIQALLRQSLAAADGVRVARHIDRCPACQEEREVQRQLLDVHRAHATQAPATLPQVPGYVVEPTPLGHGAYGEVYRATHPILGTRALKTLRPQHVTPEGLDAFRDEARVMADLPVHAHRVQVHDIVDLLDGGAVLVLSYVDGGSLRCLLPLSWERAVRYALGAGEGLRDLHARGRLHRDIKPANLLLDTAADRAVLADYGLATLAADLIGLAGTAGYIAPETLDQPATPKSDVFSLAATLHALATGQPPFPGNAYSAAEQARDGLFVPSPAFLALPAGVREVIRLGLEPDPEKRPGLNAFLARLRVVHLHELAESLWAQARATPSAVRLVVDLWTSAGKGQPLRHLRTCRSDDAAPTPPEVHLPHGHVLELRANANADGYLTVLNFDSEGEVECLVPSERAPNNRLGPGQTQTVGLHLRPSPSGDHVGLVWTPATAPPNRGVDLLYQRTDVPGAGGLTAVVVRVLNAP